MYPCVCESEEARRGDRDGDIVKAEAWNILTERRAQSVRKDEDGL